MLLFDFECPECGNIFEELVGKEKLTCECPECGSFHAARMISAPRIMLDGCSGDFPTAYSHWEKIRRGRYSKESESED